jgi:trans-2,3-dihydro-3-hydroxyanthranilate isomerase
MKGGAMRRFRIVNVFAREGRLTGNPLCVFEDGSGLDGEVMQALARQFNLSETTFILPSTKATAQVRIFTPAYEMPFAGHPTLGTAHVVRSLKSSGDKVTLEMKAGVIPVEAEADRWTLSARPAQTRLPNVSRGEIAAALSLEEADLASDPLWVSTGTEQLMVPVRSAAAVDRARPDSARFLALGSAEPVKAYVFHDEGDAARRVKARFFFPTATGVSEDPATGSACANLGGWFGAARPGADVEREVSQGEAVQRPSTLRLTVRSGSIFVGGSVIELGRGTIDLL